MVEPRLRFGIEYSPVTELFSIKVLQSGDQLLMGYVPTSLQGCVQQSDMPESNIESRLTAGTTKHTRQTRFQRP